MIHHLYHGNRTARLFIEAAMFLLFVGAALPVVADTTKEQDAPWMRETKY